ncbi:MAG: hypothetical protein R3C49_07920 [Planctomycetaceae bacterium]
MLSHPARTPSWSFPERTVSFRLTTFKAAKPSSPQSDAVLLQLEIPMATVPEAIRQAHAAGVRIILDPAPASAEFPDELLQVDPLCPNEHEAELLDRDAGQICR